MTNRTSPRIFFYASVLVMLFLVPSACSPGETTVVKQPVNPVIENQLPPRPDGLIGDTAGVLSASDIQSLQQHAEEAGRAANMQIGVSVVPTTNGNDIAEFARNTARAWGVGKFAAGNRSVLIQIAINDRKSRLEVSRHFEGVLTDAQAGQTLDLAKPAFRARNFAEGIHKIIEGVKQKGQQQLTMVSFSGGAMYGFAAPIFLGFGFFTWVLLLLGLFLVGYVIYRVFFAETEAEAAEFSGRRPGYSSLDSGSEFQRVDAGGFAGGYYRNSTPRSEDTTARDEAFDALAIAALAASASPNIATGYDSAPREYVPVEPEQESFGGQPDFGGGGATRSFEVDDTPAPPSSGLLHSVSSYKDDDDNDSGSSGGSSSWGSSSDSNNDSDSSSDSSSDVGSDGGSSDF